jgi:hemolysin activation/secretion protein
MTFLFRGGRHIAVAASCAAALAFAAPSAALAQVIERHPPVLPQGGGTGLSLPGTVSLNGDTTPIVAALQAIVLLGPVEALHGAATSGVTIGAVPRLGAAQRVIEGLLAPYLGQPLSAELINQIKATIAQYFRAEKYPFVSLSTPAQEVSDGILQLRVVEFSAGVVQVSGASPDEAEALREQIRLRTGEPINSDNLSEDLYWINRYPFRQVQAVFSPGVALGDSDLTLAATSSRPWQLYGGYETEAGGAASVEPERFYAGGVVGGVFGRDSQLAVQATVSRDAFSAFDDAAYEGLSASYILPAGARGQIEVTADASRSNSDVAPFSSETRLLEDSAAYRFGIPVPFGAGGFADARFGVEGSAQTVATYFGGIDVNDVAIYTYQAFAGLHYGDSDKPDASAFDVSLHVSPGWIGGGASQGSVPGTYAYVDVSYKGQVSLPLDVTLATEIIGQYSPFPLPSADQQALGDDTLVRGYGKGEGSYDTQLVARNELRAPALGVGTGVRWVPYLFADAGYGRESDTGDQNLLASAGLGFDVEIANMMRLKLEAANALKPGKATEAGAWSAHVQATASF